MKMPLRTTLFRLAFLFTAMGGAYFYGLTHQAVSFRTNASAAHHPKKPAQKYLSFNEVRDALGPENLARGDWQYNFMANIEPKINPKNILDLIQSLDDMEAGKQKNFIMERLIGDLMAQDPELALSLVGKIEDAGERQDTTTNILLNLMRSDPQAVVGALATLAPGEVEYGTLFGNWARSNVSSARDAALNLPPGSSRDQALSSVGQVLASADPQAALNWALSLPPADSDVLTDVVADIGSHIARNEQVATALLDNLPDVSARNDAILAISKSWGAVVRNTDGVPLAIDWLNQVATGVTYDTAVNNVITRLVDIPKNQFPKPGPAAYETAGVILDQIADPGAYETTLTTLATKWGAFDPQAALTWAQSLSDSDSTSAQNLIVTSWAKSDPVAAAVYVQDAPDPSAFLSTDPALAQSLAAVDPGSAFAFTNSLPDGDTKNQALNNVLVGMSQSDFASAWTDAASLPATDNPLGIMTNLAGALANQNPAQAAGLIAQFPAGIAQDNAMSVVAAAWVKQDPPAFTAWLATQPMGDVRDTAIAQLVASLQATKNPAGVLEWVNTVSNPQAKAALLQQLAPAP